MHFGVIEILTPLLYKEQGTLKFRSATFAIHFGVTKILTRTLKFRSATFAIHFGVTEILTPAMQFGVTEILTPLLYKEQGTLKKY
jgi:hypothetical protein